MKRLAQGMIGVLASFGASAPAAAPMLSGQYEPSCGPTDGAAFVITLPAKIGRFSFFAEGRISNMGDRWTIGGTGAYAATLSLCSTGGEQPCVEAVSGSFRTGPIVRGTMRGSFTAKFAKAPTYRYAFTAIPAPPPKQPFFCG